MQICSTKTKNVLMPLLLGVALSTQVSCGLGDDLLGKNDSGSGDGEKSANNGSTALACGESSVSNDRTEMKIQTLDGLGKKILSTFGPNSDRDPERPSSSILESHADVFPTSEDKDFGGVVADTVSNEEGQAVLMSAQIIGGVLAYNCSQLNNDECKCDDEESAAAMLRRAIPTYNACVGTEDKYVLSLAELCKSDPGSGIKALASSLAFIGK